ncbi:ATPase, T2SS/T4P/T4SS family [Verrucomicrobia bacterium]|jgi:type II secretory ATPase GspE/PulE/Tfp pilus assembly ATPase PilB-like protein|nr:ATPase, T2SS/T4P/T4SS family [Verrucomicrobiota bacterium]
MPAKSVTKDWLSQIDLFSGLSKDQLKKLVSLSQKKRFKKGAFVFKQGDPSEDFQIIQSGRYEVFLWDEIMKIERPLSQLAPGEVFGEIGVLTGESRSASIRCVEEGVTWTWEKKRFVDFLEKNQKGGLALARTLAHRLNASTKARQIPLEHISTHEVSSGLVQLLPLKVILQYEVLPLSRDGNLVKIGMVDPTDLIARNTVLSFLKLFAVEWVCVAKPEFEQFRDQQLRDLAGELAASDGATRLSISYDIGVDSFEGDDSPEVVQIFDQHVRGAIDSGASDLHYEPGPDGVRVRARIDGRLVDLAPPLEPIDYRPIVSRIKVLCDLNITERRLPQDGSMRIGFGERLIDIRVSCLPTPRGESVVMRFLDPKNRSLNLESLVLSEPITEWVREQFMHPGGLVLATGPTGSGKTTTLYAGIQARLEHDPTCKLVTVEDPVEYEFNGATQVQVNEPLGLTFTKVLRSLLRQDPNLILLGEMRDRESMGIAFEAALTGHFVMSSLHTNDAFETITRLRQQGIPNYLIASCLTGIISQRLVPKLCYSCSSKRRADKETLERLRQAGVIGAKETPYVWKSDGCTNCLMTGSKGRVGLYEILAVSSKLKEGIEHGLGERELQKVAGAGDFLPMRRYARFLLDNALVDPDELVKVFPRKVERNEKAMFGSPKNQNQPARRPAPKKATATKKKSVKRSTRKK